MSAINMPVTELRELDVSNHMLGDRAALAAAWARDGYWLLRDRIAPRALARLQRAYLDTFIAMGIVDAGAETPVFNGKTLAETRPDVVTDFFSGIHFKQPEPWVALVEEPSFIATMTDLIGGPPRRLPFAGTRAFPPDTGEDLARDRVNGPHQDAFFNEGYSFIGCWVSVWDAPRINGGLAIAPGFHQGPLYQDRSKPPHYPIIPGSIPDDAWRTADYRAGDILLFHHRMPHTGIRNRSARDFRVSFDVRYLTADQPDPIYGKLVSATDSHVTVAETGGNVRTFELTDDFFCRGRGASFGLRLPASEITKQYPAGYDILVALEDGKVRILRGTVD
jgi:hypothetical protein